ncbi:DUF222 domain-containing protein [Microtetraspora sp. NBRC 16547]|uniref:DUF222 domain-containing protein n=1 Tax=Microtetraspora sp. NBRC 16547 TaxID=3030993 RepID=UPI002554CFE4|nr:DUF222 domain-containing protein [Microtetraspora sp. NBRC 16547]
MHTDEGPTEKQRASGFREASHRGDARGHESSGNGETFDDGEAPAEEQAAPGGGMSSGRVSWPLVASVRETASELALALVPDSPGVCLAEAEDLLFARDRLISAIAARVERVHAAGEAKACGHASTKSWLRTAAGMSVAGAGRMLALAVELARLPTVRARFADGSLAEGYVTAICAATGRLTDEQAALAEPILITLAEQATPAEIARAGRYLHAVLNPDGEADDAEADYRQRFLLVRESSTGGLEGEFRLPREAGARLRALLDAYAKPKAEGDDRPLRVRNADTLIALLEHQIGTELLVLVNAESLPDDPPAAPSHDTPARCTPAQGTPAQGADTQEAATHDMAAHDHGAPGRGVSGRGADAQAAATHDVAAPERADHDSAGSEEAARDRAAQDSGAQDMTARENTAARESADCEEAGHGTTTTQGAAARESTDHAQSGQGTARQDAARQDATMQGTAAPQDAAARDTAAGKTTGQEAATDGAAAAVGDSAADDTQTHHTAAHLSGATTTAASATGARTESGPPATASTSNTDEPPTTRQEPDKPRREREPSASERNTPGQERRPSGKGRGTTRDEACTTADGRDRTQATGGPSRDTASTSRDRRSTPQNAGGAPRDRRSTSQDADGAPHGRRSTPQDTGGASRGRRSTSRDTASGPRGRRSTSRSRRVSDWVTPGGLISGRTLPGLLLSTGQFLPVTDIHRLASTSSLTRLVMNAEGRVLDVGRTVRRATRTQRRAILARYATCMVDDCHLPAHLCQIDHVQNWSDAGATDLDNLGPTCQFHNRDRYQHPERYQLHRVGDNRWAFTYIGPRPNR